MHKTEYKNFSWKKNKLYHQDVYWGELIPHDTHPKMWKILWAGNGEFSTDFWNKTRAQDNFIKMACHLHNMMAVLASEKPVDAK